MYNGHVDVTALLRVDGTIAVSYYYDAFGNILQQTGSVNNNITYAGYQYDSETGLYYLNSRYYDSKIARFLSEDTYTGDPNDPLSLNLYSYCHNEPIMYWDPTGHWEVGDSDRSAAAQAQILDATKAYIEAKASGNTDGMAAARQKAQDARSGNVYQDNSRVSSTSIANELSAVLSSSYVTQAARNDAKSSDMSLAGSTAARHDPDARKEQTSIINTINQARKDTNSVNSKASVNLSLDDVYRYSFNIGLSNNMNMRNADKNLLSGITPELLFKSQYAPSREQTLKTVRQVFGEEAYQALLKREKQYNHDILSTLGYVAEIGDAGDGLLYALEGDFSNAKWSLGAMVPFIGSAIKPAKKVISAASKVIPDEAFVRVDPVKVRGSIANSGIQTQFFADEKIWLTKYKYVNNISDPADLETVLYNKNIQQFTKGKFSSGADLYYLKNIDSAVAAGKTNMTNGIPQWRITRDIPIKDIKIIKTLNP